MKICTVCKNKKAISDFYNRYSSCKSCTLKIAKIYRENNPSKVKQWAKNSRIRNRNKNILYLRRWRDKNKERHAMMSKNWREKYIKKYPWHGSWVNMKNRCNHKSCTTFPNYGGRGIKLLITFEEVGKLWFRDKAYLLKRPSIDRKDPDGHYIYKNCRFIELSINQSRGGKNRYKNKEKRL